MTSSLRAAGTELGDDATAFDFEGREIRGRPGETLAAALTAAGLRELRETARGAPRGLFCGMGVCQDCLVEIDGRANRRACMTKLQGVRSVRRQGAGAPAAAPAADAPPPASDEAALEPDILIVGGGAGGLNAAATAARAGARVLVVDERPQPGGQYYKQPLDVDRLPPGLAGDSQFAGGQALIRAAQDADVGFLHGAQVWGAFEPLDLMILDGGSSRRCRPQRLIVAAGAYERGLPVPGWTLPGVMTTGAAQTLLRSYQVLPGRRVLVAGNGPLNLQVAVELAQAGAEVAAVAELAPRPGLGSVAAVAGMLSSTPGLALRGRGYVTTLARRGVPLLYGHVLAGVARAGDGLRAEVATWPPAAGVPRHAFEVDAVCMGYGFMPSNEILRALGCRHAFDPARGHLVTERDANCLTSVDRVYAVGDCTGLGGAPAAEAEGIIAGLAAAVSLGLAPAAGQERAVARARARLRRHRRFQAGLWSLFRAPHLLADLATPETIICRCEELTLSEIQSGFDDGSGSIGSVKRATRAGMGRCQGRYCGPVLAALTAARQGQPLDEAGHWAPRPPVKPVRISDIVGL
ncbi:MAG: FAD-dependent oxidoreductase [Alphaproteobacteria bacterium]|nr:FAD-dependent oxidoreductase [Alphaproteobacteria bacterium]